VRAVGKLLEKYKNPPSVSEEQRRSASA
jgi:hypothetical protein